MKRVFCSAMMIIAIAPLGAAAQQTQMPKPGQCRFSGFSRDTDPKGLNVRAKPSASSKIVAVLPPILLAPKGQGGGLRSGSRAPDFDVVEAKNGWFRIQNVTTYQLDAQTGDWEFVKSDRIKGWISGKYLDFVIQSEIGFERPNPSSGRVWQEQDISQPFKNFDQNRVLDCQGGWAKIEWRESQRLKRGWFRGICGVQETTCDGALGDYLGSASQ